MNDEIDAVEPGEGQTLVKTLACGICGSDLHAVHSMDHHADLAEKAGLPKVLDPKADVVLGHQFCAEILDHGPRTNGRFKAGTRVVSLPVAAGPMGMETIGFSNRFPGGFAEQMVLTEALLLEVPNGLSNAHAAMTEPMAVGEHAVASAVQEQAAYLVIGCGPVGLSVVAALKARGLGPITAVDYSKARREAAELLGADFIIDPATLSPHAYWHKMGASASFSDFSIQSETDTKARRPVIFECVGAPGLIQDLIEKAPPASQIIVVGVCPTTDKFEPGLAITKQLDFRFVVGYSAAEFEKSLRNISEGLIPIDPLLTGETGLSGVSDAFEQLRNPESQVQMMVYPTRD